MTVDQILQQRGAVYGDFGSSLLVDVGIVEAMQEHHINTHGKPFDTFTVMLLSKITSKLARIAASPDHIDSWDDLSGYSKLIAAHFRSIQKNEQH